MYALSPALRSLHANWAWFVVIGNGLAGAWSLLAHRFPAFRRKALWWFTGLVEAAVAVQVSLGTYLVAHEKYVAPKFHMFYGFVGFATVAIIYSYRRQLAGRRYLLYGYGGLFLMGLGIRAMLVGAR